MSNERYLLSVEVRLAHHQAIRQRESHPSFLDYINREPRFAGCKVTIDFQIVIDARQRRFNGRQRRLGIRRQGSVAQRRVFTDRQHHPAVCAGSRALRHSDASRQNCNY